MSWPVLQVTLGDLQHKHGKQMVIKLEIRDWGILISDRKQGNQKKKNSREMLIEIRQEMNTQITLKNERPSVCEDLCDI